MKECQPDDVEGRNRKDKKRKADAEHPDVPRTNRGVGGCEQNGPRGKLKMRTRRAG